MEPPLSSPVVNGNEDARAQAEAAPTGKRGGNWGLGELLRWCLPALLVGLALRAALTWSMPYGYVQYDSSDYLITVDRFIEDHHFFIHDKRSYLTPLLFSAAFLLPVPALITIAAAQHFMGLIATVLVGALVRLWFRFWKIAIIPITVLFAASPWIIWYEHTIMGEAQYLFFTLIMVLAGTLFARQPTMKRFLWLIVSMLLVSGTRLESKTFYLFAILLVVLLFWKQWKLTAMGFAAVVLTYVVAFHFSGNRDGSSLVYASLIRFAPPDSRATPDIMPLIRPLQEAERQSSPDYPADMVRISKDINMLVGGYVAERFQGRRQRGDEEARIVQNLCLETLKAEPYQTLITPLVKFHLAIDAWSAYCFDKRALWELQRDAFTMKDWMTLVLGRGLTGQALAMDQVDGWLRSHDDPNRVHWFTNYQGGWNDVVTALRLPDKPMSSVRWVHDFYGGVPGKDWHHNLPGVPFFYIAAFLGMIVSIIRPSPLRPLHFAWVATMLGGLYLASMVGVTNGRFRFVYEPFFVIYLFLLIDCVAGFVKRTPIRTESPSACST